MFSVQLAAGNGSPPPPQPPPSIPNFCYALPWFSDVAVAEAGAAAGAAAGTRGGAGCDGGRERNNSSRLLGCFISLSLPSASVTEDRNPRRRRSRNRNRSSVENRDTIRGVGSRLLHCAAASPKVLPEWLGRLGLDKKEEEALVAAFAALPEPRPPAAADAKLVQAAKDLVMSIKKPERGGRAARGASGLLQGVTTIDAEDKEERVRAVPATKTEVPLKAAKREPLSLLEDGEGDGDEGGSVELKAARTNGASLEVNGQPAERKRTVREPLTKEEVETRDRWLKERLRLDDAGLARMKEVFPHVGDIHAVQ